VNVSCALDPRSVSPLWCLSAYRSWAAQTSIVLVDLGVKINGAYYRDVLLSEQLGYYPWCARYRENFSSFNRTTPQHTGTRHCDFSSNAGVPPGLWPANSPDLNPVDYRIWSVVQQRVYKSRVHNTDELKQCVQQVWRDVDQSIIDNAIDEWHMRLRACVQANGGHFEHML